jgi:hypothetical protein
VRRLTAKYFGTFPHRVNIPAAIFKLTHNLISLQIKTFRSRVKKKDYFGMVQQNNNFAPPC